MAAPDAPKTYRAWWLLAISALGVPLVGANVWMTSIDAEPGIDWTAVKPYVIRLAISPGGDAARNGLRTGDLVDLRLLQPAVRYRFLGNGFVIGDRVTIPVLRDGRMLRFTFTTKHHAGTVFWHGWLAFAGILWLLLFAVVIAWRRPQNVEARMLSLFLSTFVIGGELDSYVWYTNWPVADAWANGISPILTSGSSALFAAYTMLFARPIRPARFVLAWFAYGSCIIFALYGVVSTFVAWTVAADPNSKLFGSNVQFALFILMDVAVLVCAIATLLATRGAERTRMTWALASVGLYYLVSVWRFVAVVVSPANNPDAILANLTIFLLPLGLTYSVLNRRLLDIGYALNRATVFTILSLIIVGAFMLAEWLMGSWLAAQSHVTNIVISALLVVVLGFSSRAIHQRVDRFVDLVFFRKRHEDETAIRDFAREAAFVTDPASLLTSAAATLERHADAASVAFALDDGRGRYGSTGADDPAIVALQTRHRAVDLHGMGSAFRGEFAYPMAIGGRLVGVLVLGPKRSGEPYAPDESHAIAGLATAVGGALALQPLAPRKQRLQAT
jgi:hypothetical protein